MADFLNATERKTIGKASKALEDAKDDLQALWQDAEERFSDKSEKWQDSETGATAKAALDELDEISHEIDALVDRLAALEGAK